jgi:ketosteroid isomerase-like protein
VTSANLELLRRIYAGWERGDYSSADWADPDIEFALADGPNPGSWAGLAEMGRAWGEAIAPFDHLTVEAEEYRELDDERVLVLTRNHGRGHSSGLDLGLMPTRGANLFHIRAGRVTKLVLYFDRDNAPS